MIAVTIAAGNKYEEMGTLAAMQFARHSGLSVHILTEKEQATLGLSTPHHLKFYLFDLFPEVDEIIFFDADLVMCEDFNPATFRCHLGFSAVRDLAHCWWIQDDAKNARVEAKDYFNSGLFWIARSRISLLQRAKELLESKAPTMFNDQTYLNRAAAETGGVCYLPDAFNMHVSRKHTENLDGVIGAHFHWLKDDMERLKDYYLKPRSMFWKVA